MTDGQTVATPTAAACPVRARRAFGRAAAEERVLQALVGAACVVALGVGAVLVPSPTGTDTHTQLGLPTCGMLKMTGRPCPTCGVTTAFTWAAHGRIVKAFGTQPFGLVCFGLVVVTLGLTAGALATGRSLWPLLVRLNPNLIIPGLIVILLISWAYKWWSLS